MRIFDAKVTRLCEAAGGPDHSLRKAEGENLRSLILTCASDCCDLSMYMLERIPRSVLVGGGLIAALVAAYASYTRPWYFTNKTYLGGLLFLEVLLAAVWMYRQVFFVFVLFSFLMAGSNLPVGGGWAAARWFVLGVGAFVGALTMLKERRHRFGFFHIVAFFAVLTGLLSASVSQHPDVALLKVLSVLLLFVYAATGARVAAIGRESSFFSGLLVGCEIFVAANAFFYAIGIEAMGNPNSLGAVMGAVGAPVLLWGLLVGGAPKVRQRRLLLYTISIYLVFSSHARAGIAAALLSSAVLCLALRKYKPLVEGATVLVIALAATALIRPNAISSLTSSVVYKNSSNAIFASRISPWQSAIDNIRDHPWFGMGLGTTAKGADATEGHGVFSSTEAVTAEHGSSYLAILAGVGILGAIPFAIVLLLLIARIVRTLALARASGSMQDPAIVLAALMIAGLLHAFFEDWMFAPGNYLCVFFWSLAFIFVDLSPARAVSTFGTRWNFRPHGPYPYPVVSLGSTGFQKSK